MQFSNEILIRLIMIVLGVCGFLVAKHIHKHKTQNTPLVCMVGFDCHTVVHSDYSKFFGVPVEFLGMLYYAFISIVYLILILVPQVLSYNHDLFILTLSSISLVAFLFSLYLIAVQIFILKKGCSWCIVSAFISALIFILTVIK
ncbi:MAG TPA: vitamin K epoxide reductase family protein [Candidatus Paceibacterota bacterium]|jgi:uncharacterized membrane protein|nr:vitamin K epoxide reductase family protein [Candidatus Paceibacterota bacterium]